MKLQIIVKKQAFHIFQLQKNIKDVLIEYLKPQIKSQKQNIKIKANDIIVCVQGDEPMLKIDMIQKVISAIKKNKKAGSIVLGMFINDKKQFYDPNIVKIIHNKHNEVLYTSRSPVPYCKKFSHKTKAKRIYGIFAFRYSFLKKFNLTKESFLEKS